MRSGRGGAERGRNGGRGIAQIHPRRKSLFDQDQVIVKRCHLWRRLHECCLLMAMLVLAGSSESPPPSSSCYLSSPSRSRSRSPSPLSASPRRSRRSSVEGPLLAREQEEGWEALQLRVLELEKDIVQAKKANKDIAAQTERRVRAEFMEEIDKLKAAKKDLQLDLAVSRHQCTQHLGTIQKMTGITENFEAEIQQVEEKLQGHIDELLLKVKEKEAENARLRKSLEEFSSRDKDN
uniref:Uncharacterized protein n=1 Tax=Hanusia phi TaxID=3032 RepID=A0A7S0E4Z5_9CRYP|mmetsp:Transcript_14831/g.34088  ORF Transcript_14831/g.34088 Transcript_14831/m.34088 type:complete len:236 (+) Transcript_14831:54-761(+)